MKMVLKKQNCSVSLSNSVLFLNESVFLNKAIHSKTLSISMHITTVPRRRESRYNT